MMVWMETPYRLKKLLEDLVKSGTKREIFLGMDLGCATEKLLRGPVGQILKDIADSEKREFVLIVSPN
jgi:16S rRNA (cytidine1402-2'-O)-methyltransferase